MIGASLASMAHTTRRIPLTSLSVRLTYYKATVAPTLTFGTNISTQAQIAVGYWLSHIAHTY